MTLWLCGLEDATILVNEDTAVWMITHDGRPTEHGQILKNGAVTRWEPEEEKYRICERITHRLEAFNDYVQNYKTNHQSLRKRVLSGETYAH